jgi:molybdate transport system substrate-binding protein
MIRFRLAVCVTLGLVAGCGNSADAPLRVFAAASTREALEQVAADFRARTGLEVALNLGPSSELARQIEQGAPADLFLSADESWADFLADKGLAAERRDTLSNRLVVVVPADSALEIHELSDLGQARIRRLALAGPAVPAGRYARQALTAAGVWERVRSRVLEAADVRATLTYVVRGEAEAGFVYATDVQGNPNVRIVVAVEPDLHRPIRYPLVLIKRHPIRPGARCLYDYLGSEKSAEVFRHFGFGFIP